MIGVYGFEWLETFKGCLSRDTVWVEILKELEVSIEGPDSLCVGQTAQLQTAESYEGYQWDDGRSTRSIQISGPGEYCVRVFTAEGCTKRVCREVKNGAVDVPSIMGNTVLCPGESELLQVVPRYDRYEWSTGDTIFFINVSMPGTYCITVTDFSGCAASNCTDVVLFRDRTHAIVDSMCWGDTLYVLDEALYHSGIYEIRRDDGEQCDTVVNVDLLVYDSIYISDSLVIKDDGSGNGAISVNIRGGLPPYKYLWSTGADIPFVNGLTADIYSLIVRDQNDCSRTFVFDLRMETGVEDGVINRQIDLGPNPVKAGSELHLYADPDQFSSELSFKLMSTGGCFGNCWQHLFRSIVKFRVYTYASKAGRCIFVTHIR